MIRALVALAAAALALFAEAGAKASPEFPQVIHDYLALSYVPACTLCHAPGAADAEPADTPFARSAIAAGLKADDDDSLRATLDAMRKNRVDSVGDGESDVDKLVWGRDPNVADVPMGGPPPPPVSYGCGVGATGRAGATSTAVALLAALGAVVSVRARGRGLARLVVLAVACAAGTACFVGYDSRYFEAKNAQKRVATQAVPSAIAASTDAPPPPALTHRVLRARVRPNKRYLAQTVDAPKHVADLVSDANGVLAALAVTIEVDRIEPWNNETDERLEPALVALAADDPGKDVYLVIGFIGSLPRQTDSLHELGMAQIGGKHIVVRAVSREGEQAAVDRGFYELSEDDRHAFLRKHERHRALAIFLHELGHALGALHETDEGSLMQPIYSPKMSAFGENSVALMRVALDHTGREEIAREQLAILRRAQGSLVPADRDAQTARLEAILRASDERAKSDRNDPPSTPALVGAPTVPRELSAPDRERFEQALGFLRAGRAAPAYQVMQPLFSAYPNVLAVQDLRCQLATLRYLDPAELKSECAPFIRLSPAGDAGPDASR